MSNFNWLEKLVRNRTPGPWHMGHVDEVSDACSINSMHEDGYDLIATVYPRRDQAFIATMGTIADLLLAVVKAANKEALLWDEPYCNDEEAEAHVQAINDLIKALDNLENRHRELTQTSGSDAPASPSRSDV